ncbi:hypothetical protein D3C86_2178610 [compost metagenome]
MNSQPRSISNAAQQAGSTSRVAAGSGSGQRLRSQAVAPMAPAAYSAMAAANSAMEMAASGAGMPPKR